MTEKVEVVERARARARRPGPNFWLGVNKALACGYTSLILKELKETLLEGHVLGLGSSGIQTRA